MKTLRDEKIKLEFLRKNHCDFDYFVCCGNFRKNIEPTTENTTTESTPADEFCTTPNNLSGVYRIFRSCGVLLNLTLNKPISTESLELIRDSKHPTKNESQPVWVCCPLPEQQTTVELQEQTTTEEPPETTTRFNKSI